MNLAERFQISQDDPLINGLTYGQVWYAAERLVEQWEAQSVYPFVPLEFEFLPGPDYLTCYLACAIGGFIACPLPTTTDEQLGLDYSGSSAPESLYHHGTFAIIHTSGTTGESKPIEFTLEGVCGIAESYGKLSGMNKHTHMHHILLMSHNAGFVNTLFAPMMCGGQITVDTFKGIRARSFDGKGDFLVLTPRIAGALLKFHKHKDTHPFWNYRTVQTTAERLPDELAHKFLEVFGIRLVDVYGTTELGGPFIVDGKMLPELEYRLDEENGLHVKSPFCMVGHDPDEFMDTWDVAKVTKGRIRVHGRKKERLGEELELTRKLSQKSVLERIEQIKAGTSTAPWVVELDPTSACNLACPDCISIKLLNQGGFNKSRLGSLATEMVDAGVMAVILIGGGEPMAHPAFGDIMETFGEGGLHIGVTTNGTLIDRYSSQLAEHANWVRVSMDAGTPETYLRFRPAPNGVCRFNDVIEQMERYANVKTGKLGYSFLILTHADGSSNVRDIYAAGRLGKELGCDYFEVKPSYDEDHYLIPQSRENIEIAKEQIASLRSLADTDFRVITPATLESVLEGKRLHQPKEYTSCAVSQLRTLITPTGAYVCPYMRGKEKFKVGDLTKQSFTEMWADRSDVVNPSKDCRFHCIRHKSNLILEDMFNERTETDLVKDYDFFI